MLNQRTYPPMSRDQKEQIDGKMKAVYGAAPSVVTAGWVESSAGVWVKSFCTPGATDADPPTLYIVHFGVETKRAIVYRAEAALEVG